MLLISSREYRIGGGGGDRAVACDRVNRLETRCTEVLVRRTAEEIIAAPGVITEHSELEKGRIPKLLLFFESFGSKVPIFPMV